jgi:hypothetical protein
VSELVDPKQIETLVGVKRHQTIHWGHGDWKWIYYILHSQECLDSGRDLRECEFSLAMDRSNTDVMPRWPVELRISSLGYLVWVGEGT